MADCAASMRAFWKEEARGNIWLRPCVRIAHFTLNNCPLDDAFFMVSVLEYKLYFVLRSLAIQRDEDRH